MANKGSFLERAQPMKIGTVPCLAVVHGGDKGKVAPGNWIRVQECEGDRWHMVLVERVGDDGYVFASR